MLEQCCYPFKLALLPLCIVMVTGCAITPLSDNQTLLTQSEASEISETDVFTAATETSTVSDFDTRVPLHFEVPGLTHQQDEVMATLAEENTEVKPDLESISNNLAADESDTPLVVDTHKTQDTELTMLAAADLVVMPPPMSMNDTASEGLVELPPVAQVLASADEHSNVLSTDEPQAELASKIAIDQNVVLVTNQSADEVSLLRHTFQFDTDKSQVGDQDDLHLADHAAYLLANPHKAVHIKGHADARGAKTYNQTLSEKRANSIADKLFELGVLKSQVKVIGFGDQYPLNNPESYAQNRRVELEYVDNLVLNEEAESLIH